MTDPSKATEKAPESFQAKFETTKGDVVFDCTRSWAPNGVDRFYNLVKIGFFDDVALFRVAKGFVVQWGIHGDPKVASAWANANIPPDPVKQSNTRGTLTYAMAGSPDTRSTQLFINYGDNSGLDRQGFGALCKVASGMEVVDSFNGEYGESITDRQGEIQARGNAFLKEKFPNLDYIKTATIVGEGSAHGNAEGKLNKEAGDGQSSLPYVIALFAFLGAIIYFLMRGTRDEKKPEPKAGPPGKKKKNQTKKQKPKGPAS